MNEQVCEISSELSSIAFLVTGTLSLRVETFEVRVSIVLKEPPSESSMAFGLSTSVEAFCRSPDSG